MALTHAPPAIQHHPTTFSTMQLRSGCRYAPMAVQKPRPFRTNLRYGDLVSKAVALDQKLGDFNEELADRVERGLGNVGSVGSWSPVSLSPLSTPPSSPQVLPIHPARAGSDRDEPTPDPFDLGSDLSDLESDMPDLEDCDDEDEGDGDSGSSPARSRVQSTTALAASGGAGESKSARKRRKRKAKRVRTDECKKKAQSRRCIRRREERVKTAARKKDWDAPPKVHGPQFAVRPTPASISIDDVDAAVEYKVTKGAYTVRRLDSLSPVPWEREELNDLGFRYFAWCGQTAYVILDNQDRIIAVLVPPPAEDDRRSPEQYWDAAMARVADLFESERVAAEGTFTTKQTAHRRGDFTAIATGVSYGGGQTKPGNLRQARKGHERMLSNLTQNPDVQRIANYQSDILASYFPKVYAHVYDSMATLSKSQPELRRNFQGSIYPTTTFNLGPDTICKDHNDCNNAPDVPCAITALGTFDPDKGGELYFFDLALIVRFPPGTTILLSSASIRHGNLPTCDGERRYSMTQYCPGGLLRWVRHGLRPVSSLTATQRKVIDGSHKQRWATVLGRLSKFEELEDDRRWLMRWERGEL